MIFKKSTLKFTIPALLLVHLGLLANTMFTLWPEMVVYPYLLNNGYLLYKDIINPYPPLLAFLLSGFAGIFGYHPQPYQILTWIVILFIDLLIFFTNLKLSKNFKWATLSLSFFVLISLQLGINGLWFDLVQTPLIILAFYNFYLFLSNRKTINLNFSLLLLLIALLIKQQTVWLLLWFSAVIIYTKRYKLKNFIKGLIPAFFTILLVYGVLIAYFIKLKTYQEFLFWTITFPFAKASSMPGYILLPTLKQLAVVVSLFFLTSSLVFRKNSFQNFAYFTAVVLLLFAYPRFDYFHLIPSLSMIAIGLGSGISKKLSESLVIKALVVLTSIYLIIFSGRYFKNNWQIETRFFEPRILASAKIISQLPTSEIYIQNAPQQLLPLSNKLPIKPWATEFPWYLEKTGLQDEIVLSLKHQNPTYIVFEPYLQGNKFDLGTYQPEKIVNYIDSNYKIITKIQDELWLKVEN